MSTVMKLCNLMHTYILHFDHHKTFGWLPHILMEQILTMEVYSKIINDFIKALFLFKCVHYLSLLFYGHFRVLGIVMKLCN